MPTPEEHILDVNNPHQTTKAQIGLGNVENYPPASLSDSTNPNVVNKYTTPGNVHYAIDSKVKPANNETTGVVKINSGLNVGDDTDILKALSANGLIQLVSGDLSSNNAIQNALSLLNKRQYFNITSVSGVNALNAVVSPSANTQSLFGLLTFLAVNDNTSSVTFNTGGSAFPIVKLDDTQLEASEIKAGNKYSILPVGSKFYILNPTIQEDHSYVDTLFNNHNTALDPHPQYLTSQEAKDIYDIGFRGAYLGVATLSGVNYSVNLNGTTVVGGIFSIEFSASNPSNSTLTINGVTKPIYDFDGNALVANEVISGEIRVLVNTPNYYKLHSVRSQINSRVLQALSTYLQQADPFTQYWNDDRGLSRVNTAINTHEQDSAAHAKVTQSVDGFMSKEDKIKLDAILGTNTGDETTASIVSKLNVVLDIGQL
jgi:hypothetical protein